MIPIPGHPRYLVSDAGEVFSLARNRMIGYPDKRGRLNVELDRKHFFVHQLVLLAFIGPRPEGMECCHNNGDHTDNRLSNLRWDTHDSNMKDREKHGTALRGSSVPNAKLTEADIPVIRDLARQGVTMYRIAKNYGIDHSSIKGVLSGRAWRHV